MNLKAINTIWCSLIKSIIAFLENASSDDSALFEWNQTPEPVKRRLFEDHFKMEKEELDKEFLLFDFEVDSYIFEENFRTLPKHGMYDRALELSKKSLSKAKETLAKLENYCVV